MGCASSKSVDTITVYRPAPSGFAVFDINSIEEPWFDKANTESQLDNSEPEPEEKEEPTKFPKPILDKLNTLESEPTPQSWEELSKTLQVLKNSEEITKTTSPPPPTIVSFPTPRKSFSFHTLEELDAKDKAKLTPPTTKTLRKTESSKPAQMQNSDTIKHQTQNSDTSTIRNSSTVKNNIFVLRDKQERQKEGMQEDKTPRWDLLSTFPEKCPPGGQDKVVIYTTSLRGVRRTYEECARAKSMLELHQVAFDERDVSLHAEFLTELKELVGEDEVSGPVPVPVPRVYVKGRCVGGVEELSELNETGRLGRVFRRAGVERGVGRLGCEGCGGARFVPCWECGGSCKVVVEGDKVRCGKCNENGLVYCPLCL